jgi:DedD protein
MATRASAPARKRAGETGDVDPALPQKKRARQRLIGAIALCLLAAVVVPLLLDSEPTRPSSEVAIVVPARDTPLPPKATDARVPSGPQATAPRDAGSAPKDVPAARADAPSQGGVPQGAAPQGAAPADVATRDAAAKDAASRDAAARVEAAKADAAKADAAKSAAAKDAAAKDAAAREATAKDAKAAAAKAADSRSATKPDAAKDEIGRLAESAQAKASGRYLLQVGAFGTETGAAAAVDKVEAAGLRAFTEKIKTDRGERVRVRVGPFASRDAAEAARGRLKSAGIEAAVIAP